MPLYFFYTVQREVTLNVNLVTFWRENADGRLCSPMASVTLITGLIGLKSCLHIVMPFAVDNYCLNTSAQCCTDSIHNLGYSTV